MFCPHCAATLDAEDRYCPACGDQTVVIPIAELAAALPIHQPVDA
jgi:RNA polymerase subunit RPABC4/transcription elongation factor Spt4